jgi:hypothetical protein
MASKSRSRKTGTSAGTTRKASNAQPLEDVMTSSRVLALVPASDDDAAAAIAAAAVASIRPVVEDAPAPPSDSVLAAEPLAAEPVKPARRRSRKTPATETPSGEESAASAPPRKRSRKTAPKVDTAPEPESPTVLPVAEESPFETDTAADRLADTMPDTMADAGAITPAALLADTEADTPAGTADDARFADALAGAFLYTPEFEPDEAPAVESTVVEPTIVEPRAEVAPAVVPATPTTAATLKAEAEAEPKVDLPFIIDIPREVPVVDESPTDDAVERALASPAPLPAGDDEWVDQVLEPTKVSIPPRPRVRPQVTAPAAKTATKPTPKPSPKLPLKPAQRPAPAAAVKPVAKPAAKPVGNAAVSRPAAANAGKAEVASAAAASRWWVALPVALLLALLLFVSRQGTSHAPVPVGVLGTWTTAYWLYENQTLEIKPDTVVATLDDTEEGRFPITKVETTDTGRELAVKISYQNARGEEKVIDFLADKDPTTALRFGSPTGLVWVRAE